MRRGIGLCLATAMLVVAAHAENGYQNVVNRRFDTIANGPLGGVVVDVADPARPVERASRLRGPAHRAAGRRAVPAWFKLLQDRRLLPANQPAPVLPLTVFQRQAGRLVQPDLARARQAGTIGQDSNRLTFDFTMPAGDPTASAWSATQRATLESYLAAIEPIVLRIYGAPAFNTTITVVHDPSLNSLNMVAYDATANQIRLELLNDVDSADPTLTGLDAYDLYVLTYGVLKAYHDDAALYYDAWEDGLVRAAQLLVIAEARPDFGFLGRDFNLLFTAYDVLNQPGLESPTFLGVEAGSGGQVMREALGTVRAYLAQAAWLKAYAEDSTFFARFNDTYYARFATTSGLAGNIPLLKLLVRGLIPQIEGLDFHDWYTRQYVFDTAVVPGAKLYVFNIPQKDFITGEPTNSLPMNVYHFQVDDQNGHAPLTGKVTFEYTAYDGFDLTPAVEGASGSAGVETEVGLYGNPAGIGSAVPLFFNIAGDQNVQQQRIEVLVSVNGLDRQIWYPNDTAADDTQVRNHLHGLVTNGFQGTLEITIGEREPITANVIQGAFKVKVPGGLPVPARATFAWTPDTSGGSQVEALRRNVMFLGPIGTGTDVEVGDAVVVLETPPEALTTITQNIPAGLSMVTIPAFAMRRNAAEVLGIPADQLRLARADAAVTALQPFRVNSLYRLWPDTPAFRPGYAYWLQTSTAVALNFEGVPANRDRPFRQHYPPGWNQIGNPFTDLNLRLGSLRVQAVDGSPAVALADAQTSGLVSSGVFRYQPGTGGYELLSPDSVLTPYEGFWINVLAPQGVTIVYPNQVAAGRALVPAGRGRAVDPNRWRVGLVATSGRYRDTAASVGVAPGAGDGWTWQDVAKPPPYGPSLTVSVLNAAWGPRSGRYAVDLREANAGAKSWDLLVESSLGSREVTLSWPDIALAPAGTALLLTDLETGTSRAMRSTAAYTFTLNESGTRRFRVTAERSTGSLAVLDLTLRPTRGGGSVVWTLSAPAEVTVQLHSQNGRLLRTLASGRAATRGTAEVAFTATDGQGRPLPAGIYRLDLIALSPDGRQVRTSRLVRVER